jgi:formate dehydrogenase major subunit
VKAQQTVRKRVAGFVRDWSLPRQAAGQDSSREAAKSTMSRQLRPRLEEADAIGTSICPFCAVGCAQLVYAKR